MKYFYKCKHKKKNPILVRLEELGKTILFKIKLFDSLVWINIEILWNNMKIVFYAIINWLIKCVEAHDEWWDKVDFKLERYTYDVRIYCERELTHWKRYFRSLHEGLD